MGLMKFGQYGYEKITDWTDEQIQEKIEECEYEIKEEYNSYLMYRAYKQRDITYLKDELSRRNLCRRL